MVSERRVRPGQYLSVGTQVISLVPLPNVWVIANYRETQMTNIRAGQRARVTVDAFPGKVLHGQVDSWSPAIRRAVCAVAAGQRDRQLHQGGTAHSGKDSARPRPVTCVTRYHLEAVRQQTLLAKSYAGTPQLTEQASSTQARPTDLLRPGMSVIATIDTRANPPDVGANAK
jgi:hypothetical protein